jgi:tol-pal system protein YbgF
MRQMRLLLLLAMGAGALFAQKKDQLVEMQRDIFLLQDQLKTLEKSQSERLNGIEKLLNTAISNQGNITSALTSLQKAMDGQASSLNRPVAAMGSKVDGMVNELTAVQTQLAELNASVRKIQGQMVDVSNAIKILQSPPSAPPDPSGPPAGMTSDALYQQALRARSSGQYDLAVQQFTDYVKFYGTTDLAANAQYYIGEIQNQQGQLPEALKSFDTVLEQFPDGKKTLDAMYMKGVVLAKMNQSTAAIAEFRALVKKSPSSEQADKARDQIRRLTAAPAKKR